MSSFEYVSVLLSIVLALGVAHILSGITAMIEKWARLERYWVFLAWCGLTLAIHVGYWRALWRFHDRPEWAAGDLTFWFVSVATLFVASRLLVPTTAPTSMRQHFAAIRRPFFGSLTLFWLLASIGPLFTGSPWSSPYRPWTVGFSLLCLSGAWVPSERYHAVLVVVWGLAYMTNFVLFQGPIS